MANNKTPTPAITTSSTYTNYLEQEISGFGQPSSSINIYDNGGYVGNTNVGADGTWKQDVALVTGTNNIQGYDYNSTGREGTTNSFSTYANPFVASSNTGPNVSIDPGVKFGTGATATLTGEVSDPDGGVGVYLTSNGSYLAPATLNANGTWSASFSQNNADLANIQAVAYDRYGNVSRADSNFELITGIVGEPYKNEQLSYSPDGSITNVNYFKNGGSLAYNAAYTFDSAGNSDGVLTGSGSSVTFAANLNDKRDEIVNFITSGSGHDVLNLAGSNIHNMQQLIAHSSTAGGATTIHLNPDSAVVLDGVNKAQFQSHANDFKFA